MKPDESLPPIRLGLAELRGSIIPYDIDSGRIFHLKAITHRVAVNEVETVEIVVFVHREDGSMKASWHQPEPKGEV